MSIKTMTGFNEMYKVTGYDLLALLVYMVCFTSMYDAYTYGETALLYYLILIVIMVITGKYFVVNFTKNNKSDLND